MVKRFFDKSPRKEREVLCVLYAVLEEILNSVGFILLMYLLY